MTKTLHDQIDAKRASAQRLTAEAELLVTQANQEASLLADLELRWQQLGEIRAMLSLPKDAPHERVLRRLVEISLAARVIDLDQIPSRYPSLQKDAGR